MMNFETSNLHKLLEEQVNKNPEYWRNGNAKRHIEAFERTRHAVKRELLWEDDSLIGVCDNIKIWDLLDKGHRWLIDLGGYPRDVTQKELLDAFKPPYYSSLGLKRPLGASFYIPVGMEKLVRVAALRNKLIVTEVTYDEDIMGDYSHEWWRMHLEGKRVSWRYAKSLRGVVGSLRPQHSPDVPSVYSETSEHLLRHLPDDQTLSLKARPS